MPFEPFRSDATPQHSIPVLSIQVDGLGHSVDRLRVSQGCRKRKMGELAPHARLVERSRARSRTEMYFWSTGSKQRLITAGASSSHLAVLLCSDRAHLK